MKFNIYVLFDSFLDEVSNAFIAVNDKVAIRQFCLGMAQQPHSVVDTLTLKCIGSYDGAFTDLDYVVFEGSNVEEFLNSQIKKKDVE